MGAWTKFQTGLICGFILVAQVAWAQPTEWQPLEREVFALNLDRVNGDTLPWLMKAHQTAKAYGVRGQVGADRMIRYLVILRQLAQVQDARMVDLRNAEGRLIGDDREAEAKRLKGVLRTMQTRRPGPTPAGLPNGYTPAPRGTGGPDMLSRELSFVEFNKRVLAMAKDPKVPLQERVTFLTIVSANMDEFFQIRVAGLKEEMGFKQENRRSDGFTARETLPKVLAEAHELQREQYRVYEELQRQLAAEGIRTVEPRELRGNDLDRRWAETYVGETVAPQLEPIELEAGKPFPRVVDKSLNLLVTFKDGKRAVVPLGGELTGMVRVPGQGDRLALVTDLIQSDAERAFGRPVESVSTFRLTRNHDLWGRTGVARQYGTPVRLEVSSQADAEFLRTANGLGAEDVVVSRGPVDLKRAGDITDVEREGLRFEKLVPARPAELAPGVDMFEAISKGERLLHHPFQSYDPVVELVQQAAKDAQVVGIKQTLYRTGGADSPIVDALVEAAEAGKKVTVLVETRARFDEKGNVENVRRLRAAGAEVIYGPPGLKTHAKLLSIERMERNRIKRYVHMGTGNYNEKSARFYTDFSLFTQDPKVGADVERVFKQLTGEATGTGAPELDRVLMAPFTLKSTILEHIATETENARQGKPASIVAKMNSLNDPEIIRALYQASKAGVQVDLIIRGLTTIRPGVVGLSENIRVRSILGQYLEHTRTFQFHDGGKKTTYLGSADWMVRNTERRVETAVRIDDPRLKAELKGVLDTYLRDNTRAWELQRDGTYRRVQPNGQPEFNAQKELAARQGQTTRRRGILPDLSRFRRASDGTLDWGKMRRAARNGTFKQGLGLAHFGLALFLKEIAVVAATGDRARIEEFFDGLKTWGFYKHYGLFVAGARLTEIGYVKYLERFVRPGFINSLLKTNLVLAAGLALPMIAEGQFTWRAFAVSVTSLGVSSTLLRTGVKGITWVTTLDKARKSGALARFGFRAGKLANVAGWFYTAAELAVILIGAEWLEGQINAVWDKIAARAVLKNAATELLDVIDDPDSTVEDVREATRQYHEAWIGYRNFLYQPLEIDEARFAERLAKVARDAKILEDQRRAALEKKATFPGMHAALDRYVRRIDRVERPELDETVAMYFESYNRDREKHLEEVYQGNRRDGALMHGRQTRGSIRSAHGDASLNRLQAYDDEDEVLAAMGRRLRRRGRTDLAGPIEQTRVLTRRTRDMDRKLVEGGGNGLIDVHNAEAEDPLNQPLGVEPAELGR